MWKHLIIVCLGLGFAKLYQLDISSQYRMTADYLASDNLSLLTNTSILAVTLIIVTLLIRTPMVLGIIRLIVKLMLEAGLFIITFISLSSIYWAVWGEGNLWRNFQPLLPVPAIFVLTAVVCTNVIDFNQPIVRDLMPYLAIAATSFLIVNLGLI